MTGTLRQEMLRHLRDGPHSARDLSALLHIREREVVPHLEHLERSLRHAPERLVVDPPECRSCGYRFVKRERRTRPGACPRCRAQRVSAPLFRVEPRR